MKKTKSNRILLIIILLLTLALGLGIFYLQNKCQARGFKQDLPGRPGKTLSPFYQL
jgi:hypothetical protein